MMVMITVALKVLVEEEEEVYTEEEVEEIKPRRVRSQRKVPMNHFINLLCAFGKSIHNLECSRGLKLIDLCLCR